MRIGNRTFDTANHTYVMGILNVTPDSFGVSKEQLEKGDRVIVKNANMYGM